MSESLDIQRNTSLSEQTTLITNPGTLLTGRKTIAIPGSNRVLKLLEKLRIGVTVKALSTNTGLIFIGINTVAAISGFQLSAGEQIFIPVSNLDVVYFDVAIANEGLTYIGN